MEDYLGGLDFEGLSGIGGERGEGLGCGVSEGNGEFHESDEATTPSIWSVSSNDRIVWECRELR